MLVIWYWIWDFTRKNELSRLMTKPTKWHLRPAKTQISLGIRPVWSKSSLSTWRKFGSFATLWAQSEDTDQTGQMPRLSLVFAGCTVILLVLSWGRSVLFQEKTGYSVVFFNTGFLSNKKVDSLAKVFKVFILCSFANGFPLTVEDVCIFETKEGVCPFQVWKQNLIWSPYMAYTYFTGAPSILGGGVHVTHQELKSQLYVPKPSDWPDCGRDQECERLAHGWEQIMQHSIAEPFLTPVDLNVFPSYSWTVEYPIDLSTMKRRLDNRFYRYSKNQKNWYTQKTYCNYLKIWTIWFCNKIMCPKDNERMENSSDSHQSDLLLFGQ